MAEPPPRPVPGGLAWQDMTREDLLRVVDLESEALAHGIYDRAGRVTIEQFNLTNTTTWTYVGAIPDDTIRWALTSSDLGTGTGAVLWSYTESPGPAKLLLIYYHRSMESA